MNYIDKILGMLKNHNTQEISKTPETRNMMQNIVRTELGQLFKGHKMDITYYQDKNEHYLTVMNTYFGGSVILTYDISNNTTTVRYRADGMSPKWMIQKLIDISNSLGSQHMNPSIESDKGPLSFHMWGGSYYVEHVFKYNEPFFSGHKENIDRLKQLNEYRKELRIRFKEMKTEEISKLCTLGTWDSTWQTGDGRMIIDEVFLKNNVTHDV